MAYLNILYFLIITALGWRWLRTPEGSGAVWRSSLDPERRLRFDGPEMFWCLTFSTGLLAFSFPFGMDLMAMRLFVLEVMCLIGLGIARFKPVVSSPIKIGFIYLAWLACGLTYSPNLWIGIRVILKYAYPLVLCLFASAAVRDGETAVKSAKLARWVALAGIAMMFIPWIQDLIIPGVFWYGTARVMSFISLMLFSVGMIFFSSKKKNNLLWAAIFILPCIFFVLRTSIMGNVIGLCAFAFIRWRVKSLPTIGIIALVGIITVFAIPSVRDKMFYDSDVTFEDFRQGRISEDNIDTNGRKAMWEKLEGMFYEGHELRGSGTGTVQDYMYANKADFNGLSVPHSDFIQQKCDNGLIGLLLYGLIIILMFFDSFRTYWQYRENKVLQLMALTAGASILGVYVTFYSDNCVNYSMATLSMPFGFYGMMLGLRVAAENQTDQ